MFALFRWFRVNGTNLAQIFNTQTKIYPVLCEHVYNLTIAVNCRKIFTKILHKLRERGDLDPL